MICSECGSNKTQRPIFHAGTAAGDALGLSKQFKNTLVTTGKFDKSKNLIDSSYSDMVNNNGSVLALRAYCQNSLIAPFSKSDDTFKPDTSVPGSKGFANKLMHSRFKPITWQIGTDCEYYLGLKNNLEKTIFTLQKTRAAAVSSRK